MLAVPERMVAGRAVPYYQIWKMVLSLAVWNSELIVVMEKMADSEIIVVMEKMADSIAE